MTVLSLKSGDAFRFVHEHAGTGERSYVIIALSVERIPLKPDWPGRRGIEIVMLYDTGEIVKLSYYDDACLDDYYCHVELMD